MSSASSFPTLFAAKLQACWGELCEWGYLSDSDFFQLSKHFLCLAGGWHCPPFVKSAPEVLFV